MIKVRARPEMALLPSRALGTFIAQMFKYEIFYKVLMNGLHFRNNSEI